MNSELRALVERWRAKARELSGRARCILADAERRSMLNQCADAYETRADELDAILARQGEGWRPISEAPRVEGMRALLCWDSGHVEQGFYLDNSHSVRPWSGWRVESMRPTPAGKLILWRELPAAPPQTEGRG